MSTVLRPEISKNNPYYISKERYYELKHFCLQYHEWKKLHENIVLVNSSSLVKPGIKSQESPVEHKVEVLSKYWQKMKMVEETCMVCDPGYSYYIFKAVTEGLSYDKLVARYELACSKDYYYDIYRKFFWLLDKKR